MTPKKPTVLLVDDEPEFLKSIQERFELRGYTTLTAQNGGEAIEIAKKERIDLAVVDLKMPDMSGLVCITKIKEMQPNIKSVLLTAYGGDKVKEATEALNSDYFEKQNMGSFWDFLKRATQRLENTMAAAGLATHGDIEDAEKLSEEDD